MMTFRDSLDLTKLDLSKLLIIPSGGSSDFSCAFDITPKDFLRYAKEDINGNEERNTVNGLSNAKRAIDCQIDDILSNLGLDYHKPHKSIESFIKCINFKDGIPFKLKIINALNLAPGFLVSKTRTIRNKLEHYYKIPSIEEAKESIDIADLFIRSVDGVTKTAMNELYITDQDNYKGEFDQDYDYYFEKGYSFQFNHKDKHIELEVRTHAKSRPMPQVIITNEQPEFYGFIRLIFSIDDEFELTESFRVISQLINHPMPIKHIKAEQY